jgi:hypothetical protein
MRVLCLHGQGSSATIFESQLSRLIAALPPHYTFNFVDAPVECGPGLDVGDVYPGPYHCFFDSYTPERMTDAIEHVREIIEEDGPYDAIIAFSQVCLPSTNYRARLMCPKGASVTAAYLSACCVMPHNEPPCAFAMFICTALISPSLAAATEKLEETVGSLIANGPLPLPTIHVLGTKDLCFPQSIKLWQAASTPGLGQALQFPGGHEIPKDAEVMTKMRDAVEKAARTALCG